MLDCNWPDKRNSQCVWGSPVAIRPDADQLTEYTALSWWPDIVVRSLNLGCLKPAGTHSSTTQMCMALLRLAFGSQGGQRSHLLIFTSWSPQWSRAVIAFKGNWLHASICLYLAVLAIRIARKVSKIPDDVNMHSHILRVVSSLHVTILRPSAENAAAQTVESWPMPPPALHSAMVGPQSVYCIHKPGYLLLVFFEGAGSHGQNDSELYPLKHSVPSTVGEQTILQCKESRGTYWGPWIIGSQIVSRFVLWHTQFEAEVWLDRGCRTG